mgnify:CR=1 FL=1
MINGRLRLTQKTKENVFCQMLQRQLREKLLKKLLKAEEICGIGVGVPAPVDKNGAIERAANVGWMAKEIKKELEELTGFPCVIGK